MASLDSIARDLEAARGMVQGRWQTCTEVWLDQKQQEFYARYMAPLDHDITAALRGLDAMAGVVGAAIRRYS